VQIYLPIADLPVDIFLVLGMGLAVGFISGMFGIGGGFLMTPLLIFIGISPAVAVASVASHIAASSCSGVISYWRRRAVDLALGLMLLALGVGAGLSFVKTLFTFSQPLRQFLIFVLQLLDSVDRCLDSVVELLKRLKSHGRWVFHFQFNF